MFPVVKLVSEDRSYPSQPITGSGAVDFGVAGTQRRKSSQPLAVVESVGCTPPLHEEHGCVVAQSDIVEVDHALGEVSNSFLHR